MASLSVSISVIISMVLVRQQRCMSVLKKEKRWQAKSHVPQAFVREVTQITLHY